jgi:hypothetical protein
MDRCGCTIEWWEAAIEFPPGQAGTLPPGGFGEHNGATARPRQTGALTWAVPICTVAGENGFQVRWVTCPVAWSAALTALPLLCLWGVSIRMRTWDFKDQIEYSDNRVAHSQPASLRPAFAINCEIATCFLPIAVDEPCAYSALEDCYTAAHDFGPAGLP